jgi:sulfur transfer protein SufE
MLSIANISETSKTLITKLIEDIKSSKVDSQRYELLINLASFNEDPGFQYKNLVNKLTDCASKTWLYTIEDEPMAYSESRLINGLIVLLTFDKESKNIVDLMDKYYITPFYSSLRKLALEALYNHLTKADDKATINK